MKKTSYAIMLFILISLPFFFPGNCFAHSPAVNSIKNIRVSSDHDYPPYEFNDEKGRPTGFNIDLINAVAEATGLRVDVRLDVWNKVRAELDAGKIDVIAGMYYSKAREEVADFSVPHNMVSSALFVRDSSAIKTFAQARDKEIVVQKGDVMHDFLIEQGFTPVVVTVDDPVKGLQLLAAGKHDCVLLSSKIQGMYLIGKHGIRGIRAIETQLPVRKYCFAVKKNNAALLQKLNEGLNILKHTGKYEQIYEKWFGVYEERSLWQTSRKFIIAFIIVLSLLAIISVITWLLRRQVKKRTGELLISQDRLYTIINTIPDLIWLKDVDGVYLSCNRMFELFFGARESDIVGKTDYDFVSNDLADFFRKNDRRAMAAGKSIINEEWISFAGDGRRVLLETIKTPMYDAGGTLIGVLGIGRDITERKKVEDALQKSEQRFRAIFNSTFQFTGLMTPDGRLLVANQAALEFAGIKMEDIVNQPFWETRWWRGNENRVSQLREAIARAAKGEFIRYEIALQGAGDTTATIDFSLKPVCGENGEVALLIPEGRDITDRKKAEEERELMISELQKALSEVKKLSGMLPICASCKKIRDDKGYWNQIESYIKERSEAQFSHGICPECMKKIYPEFDEKSIKNKKNH